MRTVEAQQLDSQVGGNSLNTTIPTKPVNAGGSQWATWPNAITLVRFGLAPVIVRAILTRKPERGAILFALAASSDGVDGFLARATGTTTLIGQYFDPVADKVLLSGVFLALAIRGSVPASYVCLVLGRDLALLVASAIAMRVSSYNNYSPTIWGKISTVFQVLTATAVLASDATQQPFAAKLAKGLVVVSAAATLWSTIHYTWRGVSFFIRR